MGPPPGPYGTEKSVVLRGLKGQIDSSLYVWIVIHLPIQVNALLCVQKALHIFKQRVTIDYIGKTSWPYSLPCSVDYCSSFSKSHLSSIFKLTVNENNLPEAGQPRVQTMVLMLDGSSEIGKHRRSNLCYLICLRHLIRSRAVTNSMSFSLYFRT